MLRIAGAMAVATVICIGTASAGFSRPNAFVRFGDLPRGWGPGIPRDVQADSRIVGRLNGETIAAAPTRNGNFCEAFWVRHRNGGFAGCRGRGPFPDRGRGRDFRSYLIGGTFGANRTSILKMGGSTLAGPRARLTLIYADGAREHLPMIWVGRPIAAGFFYRNVPERHLIRQRRAKALELREGSRLVAREVIPLPKLPPRLGNTVTGAAKPK